VTGRYRTLVANGWVTKYGGIADVVTPPGDPYVAGKTLAGPGYVGAGLTALGYPSLTTHTGDFIASTPGQVVKNLRITGRLIVRAANVVAENCEILIGPQTADTYGVDMGNANATGFLGRFLTIHASHPSTYVNGIGVKEYTLDRCNIYNVVDACRVYTLGGVPTGVKVRNSWIHDTMTLTPDHQARTDNKTHSDIMQIQGGDTILLEYNVLDAHTISTLYAPTTDGSALVTQVTSTSPYSPVTSGGIPYNAMNSVIISSPLSGAPGGPVTNLQIRNNIIRGGASAVNLGGSTTNGGITGDITNNVFDGDTWLSRVGASNLPTQLNPTGTRLNVIVPTAAPISLTGNVIGTSYADLGTGTPVVRING
jgi:hypothetical protein